MWKYFYVILTGVVFVAASIVVVQSLPSWEELERLAGENPSRLTESKDSSETVLLTKKYAIFHREGCDWLSGEFERVMLKEAEEKGAEHCPFCFEEELPR